MRIPKYCPSTPQISGIIIIEMFETPNWEPITDDEYSFPNMLGVRYVRFGNIGPLPMPMARNEIVVTAMFGAKIKPEIPKPNSQQLDFIIVQLLNFIASIPETKRPTAMPAK